MDALRFDALTRALTAAASRRTVLGTVLGGLSALGLAGWDAATKAKAKGKGKGKRRKRACRKCGPCEQCKRGRCQTKADGAGCGGACRECQGGACVARADGLSCGECFQCQGGACQPAPGAACDGGACKANGSCGIDCNQFAPNCPAGCECRESVEESSGQHRCTRAGLSCARTPRQCGDLLDCPAGEQCVQTGCGGGSQRCVPLCTFAA
jgi:hypothetical protein